MVLEPKPYHRDRRRFCGAQLSRPAQELQRPPMYCPRPITVASMSQVSTIVVAHRLSTVQHADTVFVIDKGKLVASGKLCDLERDVPLVKKYIALMSFD